MRFVCDSCRAQYTISDDKIGAKGVKVRCKKCGYNITVRSAGAAPAKDEAVAAADVGAGKGGLTVETFGTPAAVAEGGLFSNVEEDEIGAVFDQVLSIGPSKAAAGEAGAEEEEATSEAVRKLAEAEEAVGEGKPAVSQEWFVAISEKQVGPLTVEKVKDYWERGEVGPDSLCWRAGFSDWIPLSEVKELATELAPQPPKPVIVAAAAAAPVASMPTESVLGTGSLGRTTTRGEMGAVGASSVLGAGGAGRTTTRGEMGAVGAGRTTRGEMGAAGGAAEGEEVAGWKPSAASVLASLVKEENAALAKAPGKPAVAEEKAAMNGLLDVPAPEPVPMAPQMPRTVTETAMPAVAPYAPPAPGGYAPPAPGYVPAGAPYAAPGQPYAPPPAYGPTYAQAAPPGAAPSQGRTGLIIGIAAGVLLVLGGGAALLLRGSAPETGAAPPTAAAAQAPAATAPTEPAAAPAVAAAPAAGGTAQGAPAGTVAAGETAPAAGAVPATAAAAPAAGTPAAASAAPASGAAPAVAAAQPAAPASEPAAKPAEPAKVQAPVARAEPARSGSRSERTERTSGRREEEPVVASAAPVRKAGSKPSEVDDEFDELFGTKKGKKEEPAGGGRTPSAYIPPEPGGGPEKLSQSDINQVVLANLPAIRKCVNEQRKKDPGLSGTVVMRWTIQTSGRTKNVACASDEFRSSYVASCLSGLIKGWTFPKHRVEGAPINFPFKF